MTNTYIKIKINDAIKYDMEQKASYADNHVVRRALSSPINNRLSSIHYMIRWEVKKLNEKSL